MENEYECGYCGNYWNTSTSGLDKQINKFVQHINDFAQYKHVIDIKFSTCTDSMHNDIYLTALIMYEDMEI